MVLVYQACANCGFWQRHFAPLECPVCADPRNDLPEDGWQWINEDVARAAYAGSWQWLAPDLMAFSTTPQLGLGGKGWLILREEGNIAFEAAPFYSDDMLAEITRRGGIKVIAASHPHGFGALWQLQRAFPDAALAMHKDAIRFSKAFAVTLPFDDSLEIGDGLTLHHLGGHYEGQTALHDARGRRLFCGDMLKIEQDARGRATGLSAHKAFHKNIPLTYGELKHYRDVVALLDFTAVLSPFEHAPDVGRTEVLTFLDAQLSEPPGVRLFDLNPPCSESDSQEPFVSSEDETPRNKDGPLVFARGERTKL
ncbi:MAG: MBL fold metallo-hydrolase [Sphingorhabdus sp.]